MSARTIIVPLESDGSPNHRRKFIRLPSLKDSSVNIKFKMAAGSAGLIDAKLKTNYPLENDHFERSHFSSIDFVYDYESDGYCCINNVHLPGTYKFYVEYKSENDVKRSKSGYFQIPPNLPVDLNQINMKTYVPKWMGKMKDWNAHMKHCAEMGYNFVHFSPIQQRGMSNSPYSLYDQLLISSDLFEDPQTPSEVRYQELQKVIHTMEKEYNIYAVIDMVWNHTANNSAWLLDHPEAGYNLDNSPHLKSAFELDDAILTFSKVLESEFGIDPLVKSEAELKKVLELFSTKFLPKYRLWEFFVLNVEEELLKFHDDGTTVDNVVNELEFDVLVLAKHITSNALYQTADKGRFSWKITQEAASSIFRLAEKKNPRADLRKFFRSVVDEVNLPLYKKYDQDIEKALKNIENRFKFERFAENGPKLGKITENTPLVYSYFTRIPKNDGRQGSDKPFHALANNGWIWDADPLINFASDKANSYFVREVIVWGDCVKLNYGESPNDNPWLWNHMRQYTETMVKYFHGFRIDNCHSTPIRLAEYLLDHARKLRPDLYVVAELFTGSEEKDILFVSKLGLNSLIREALACWDANELSRQVHKLGGQPVGSFFVKLENVNIKEANPKLTEYIADGGFPHALFMECTHDNETLNQKKNTTAASTLPHAALVSFTCTAIGSVHGFDELYPELLNLVNDSRLYARNTAVLPKISLKNFPQPLHPKTFLELKQYLNFFHKLLSQYTEVYVHQDKQIIRVIRDHPITHDGYLLIAHTDFITNAHPFETIRTRGSVLKLLTGGSLLVDKVSYKHSTTTITGLSSTLNYEPAEMFEMHQGHDEAGSYTDIRLKKFPPGSILIFEKVLFSQSAEKLNNLHHEINFKYPTNHWLSYASISKHLDSLTDTFDFLDLNVLLYRCHNEEKDTIDHGSYNVPEYGPIAYCGLQGFVSVMNWIARENHLGHPICSHLRNGTWALDYTENRLKSYSHHPNLHRLSEFLAKLFSLVKALPSYLIPKYFYLVILTVYMSSRTRSISLMSNFIKDSSLFTQSLSLGSVQFYGSVKSTSLHPTGTTPCIAAGLPFFSTYHMRCWGRDVFIALRGLYILTGRFTEARDHIIAFATVVKHGMIPNLLDAGRYPRYNARDSVWWCLQAIQEYCKLSPEGVSFLKTSFKRRFPTDEFIEHTDPRSYYVSMTIEEFIQHVLQRHAEGIHFREWNAGKALDGVMTTQGFQIDIETSWKNGFIFGGNPFNCGTWMDKMGESVMSGSIGTPATPRDGAAIEIIGLLKSTLRWTAELYQKREFSHEGVTVNGVLISFKKWGSLIQENFEKFFYVPENPADDPQYEIDPKLVHLRGVYKDCYMSSPPYRDYQFRPNIFVAMTVAPELFDKTKAMKVIDLGFQRLVSPIGMKTLDFEDWEYRGNYENDIDSKDKAIAKGFNYHQGPEWVWVLGYFLRAYVKFSPERAKEKKHRVLNILKRHQELIHESVYAGIPELTNSNGQVCKNSCPTQAWSMSCLLDALYDLSQIKE